MKRIIQAIFKSMTSFYWDFPSFCFRLDVLAELASSQKPIVNETSIKHELETSMDETNLSLSSSSLNSSIKSEETIDTSPSSSLSSSSSTSFVLKTTQKGKPCILLDGHRYKHRRDNLDGSMSWTCTQ